MHGPRRGTPPAREATLSLRDGRLTVSPPRHRKREGVPAVEIGAVLGRAIEPLADAEPMEWLLLRPAAVESVEEAIERAQGESCRWGMEVWHRILPSGCRLAARQCQRAERWRRALSLSSVLAWRIFYATLLCARYTRRLGACCGRPTHGRRSLVPSTASQRRLRSHRRGARRSTGSRSLADLWGAVEATSLALKSCGGAFSISPTSRRCPASCALIPHK